MHTCIHAYMHTCAVYKVQSINPKNRNQITDAPNWNKKPLEVLKRILVMNIRRGKLTISFYIKLFRCLNYHQVLI